MDEGHTYEQYLVFFGTIVNAQSSTLLWKQKKKPACYRQEKGEWKAHQAEKTVSSSNENRVQNSCILVNTQQYVIVMCNFA